MEHKTAPQDQDCGCSQAELAQRATCPPWRDPGMCHLPYPIEHEIQDVLLWAQYRALMHGLTKARVITDPLEWQFNRERTIEGAAARIGDI